MLRPLFFYFLFLLFSGHAFAQNALWGVEVGMVATKLSSTGTYVSNINQHFETGLGPSLNL